MNTKSRIAIVFTLALLAGAALVAVTWAAPGSMPLAGGGAPAVVAYQGEVQVSGSPYSGDGYFKFAVVNAAGDIAYWSNDGTSTGGGEPTTAVQLTVSEGLFSVLLGDTAVDGMTHALAAAVFSQPNRYLRVWFSTSSSGAFNQLTPDTRIAAVPYALQAQEAGGAETVDGYEGAALEESSEIDADIAAHAAIVDAHHASQLGTDYQNVVVVAKSGGDYTSVQAAITDISDAAADNPYLIWVAPGLYEEQVTMKPYVHLQGAGQEATVISSTASSAWPPTQATLALASNTSLRDLTVGNNGAGTYSTALMAATGVTRTLAADVTVRALGGGTDNYAIFLTGSGTGITLQQVTALAENGSQRNYGLYNYDAEAAVLRGGSFTGRGGTDARGIFTYSNTTLEATSVTALGENGNSNYGLFSAGIVTLHDGSFTGRGGVSTYGIRNTDTLETEGVSVLAENGDSFNYGLYNYNGAEATLRGGSFTARGGVDAWGIHNAVSGATLKAESVTALGENGSDENSGLKNFNEAVATLLGGYFTGSGGIKSFGIYNLDSNTTLEAESVSALGKDGISSNYGLLNDNGAVATLRGGSFTARGGVPVGIYNRGASTSLEAESITVLGESGSGSNNGLFNLSGAEATLHGGSFTGRGGTTTYGIYNTDSGSTLEAGSVSVLGVSGSSNNYWLYQTDGTVRLGVSQLDGDANKTGGTLTCFQVYDGSYAAYTCP